MELLRTYFLNFIFDFIEIINEMSPYLMLGFFFAGLLHVFFPKQKVVKFMGGNNTKAAINASLLGIPLPLCSCGVIPTGISFYKHGASKGSAISFMTSTPQTGIDSILVTYSLLGLPFALIRPVVALFTGVFSGVFTNFLNRDKISENKPIPERETEKKTRLPDKIKEMFSYAFGEFLQDISNWLVLGLILAAIISVFVPDDFFSSYHGNDFLGKIIILVAAVPLYVCATASVPIAAVLILKGISPGAALVFLMAGPATNAATIALIAKTLGKISLVAYLSTIIVGALLFGTIIDLFLPPAWFSLPAEQNAAIHQHEMLPQWLKLSSTIVLGGLIIMGYLKKIFKSGKKIDQKNIPETSKEWNIIVEGMTCSHCKENVEYAIRSVKGVKDVQINLASGEVIFAGKSIDQKKVKDEIEGVGYNIRREFHLP
ncbi:MAG: permease [Bacteroidota bacterium]|nr:permease [Bacteroidota bacterium]